MQLGGRRPAVGRREGPQVHRAQPLGRRLGGGGGQERHALGKDTVRTHNRSQNSAGMKMHLTVL